MTYRISRVGSMNSNGANQIYVSYYTQPNNFSKKFRYEQTD